MSAEPKRRYEAAVEALKNGTAEEAAKAIDAYLEASKLDVEAVLARMKKLKK